MAFLNDFMEMPQNYLRRTAQRAHNIDYAEWDKWSCGPGQSSSHISPTFASLL